MIIHIINSGWQIDPMKLQSTYYIILDVYNSHKMIVHHHIIIYIVYFESNWSWGIDEIYNIYIDILFGLLLALRDEVIDLRLYHMKLILNYENDKIFHQL